MTSPDGLADTPAEEFADWRFAGEARGYAYHERVVAPKLRGLLFREGAGVVAERVVDALDSSNPFLAGILSAKYGPAETAISTSFIAIPLPRSMPSAVLVNARSGAFRDAGISMGTRQLLTLEGDFDRSFSLYCPIGGSARALEIFTPELMRLFLGGASDSDIEIVDNWMFVYGNANSANSEDMLDRIEVVTRSVGGAIVDPSFDSIKSEPADGAVDPSRKTSGLTLIVVSLVAVVTGGLFTWWGTQQY